MMFIFADVNSFIKKRITTKSRVLAYISLVNRQHSKSKGKVNHAPQESIGGCLSPSSRP